MSINFACITPHPPILIPAIGKDNIGRLKNTAKSFEILAKIVEKEKIETLVVISPHGIVQDECWTINASPKFEINFESFGDFVTKFSLESDVGLTYSIKEELSDKRIQLIDNEKIDYGAGVPLYCLTQKLKNIKIVPIYYSGLSLEHNFGFGKALQKELNNSKKKIGIIASGDLSHKLTEDSPAGYSSSGIKFDKKLISLLETKKIQEIFKIKPALIEDAGECGLRSIMILLGVLEGLEYFPEKLSYEGPFGIGYLSMNLNLIS